MDRIIGTDSEQGLEIEIEKSGIQYMEINNFIFK